ERVTNFLNLAPATVREFQAAVSQGVFNPRNPAALETALFTMLVASPSVSELTLTYGVETGFDAEGAIQLSPGGRGQLTVARTPSIAPGEKERLGVRHVLQKGNEFVADVRVLNSGASMPGMSTEGSPEDPTKHPTFVTPARKEFFGRLLWSDLHWSQLDAGLPPAERRGGGSGGQGGRGAGGKILRGVRGGVVAGAREQAGGPKTTPPGQPPPPP